MGRIFVILCVLSLPAVAHAQEGGSSETHWYGGQLIGADAAALTLVIASDRVDNDAGSALALIGALGLVGNGVVVHALHGDGGAAAGSLAVRLLLPSAGALIGNATCDHSAGFDCVGAVGGGMLLGFATALIIDYGMLSYEQRPVATAPGWQVGLAPRAGNGFTLAVGRVF